MAEITLHDSFGSAIASTISKYTYRINLEIGSWDGTGSTECFIEGMKHLFGTKKLYCIEVVPERYKQLVENTKDIEYVVPINQSSINYESMVAKDFDKDIWDSQYNVVKQYSKELVYSWFERDINCMKEFQMGFLNVCKGSFDAVLIDGGAFTGYSEYLLLRDRTKCFMLDDAQRDFKCNQVYRELKSSGAWTLIYDDPGLRNGAAIFIRK